MKTVCGAGARPGMKCEHKRNEGQGLVTCGINASKDKCVFATTVDEHKAEIDKKVKD